MRRPDHRAHVPETACARIFARPRTDRIRNVQEERLPLALQILKLARPRVARSNQNEHPAVRPPGAFQERSKRIPSEIRIDRQGIRIPDRMQPAFHATAAERRIRISLRGGGNVVPLAIQNRHETVRARMAQYILQGRQSLRAARFEERTLRFDHAGERANHIDDPATELFIGPRDRRQCVSAMPLLNFHGQRFPARIQTHANRSFLGANGGKQTIGKVRHVHSSLVISLHVNKSLYFSDVSLTPERRFKSWLCPRRHRRPANLLWPSVPPDYPLRQIFVTFRTKNPRRKKNSSAHWPIPVACLRILNDMATQPIAMAPAGRSTLQGQFSVLGTAYAVLRTRHPQTPRTAPRRCIIACNDEPMTDEYYRRTANDF